MIKPRTGWLLAETIIQGLILGYMSCSWYLINLSAIPAFQEYCQFKEDESLVNTPSLGSSSEYLISRILFMPYIFLSNLLLVSILVLYLRLISGRRTRHVKQYSSPNVTQLTEPFVSTNPQGTLSFCTKGSCGGAWKPPRTHHCSICGVCRLGFDHHCPWIGNCVSIHDMKAFLVFLALVPITFVVCVAPFASLLVRHAYQALSISKTSSHIRDLWWNKWYSWLPGGPLGRYLIGTVMGYQALKAHHPMTANEPAAMFLEPNFRTALIALVGLVFACFALLLGARALYDTLRGMTTLDNIRAPGSSRFFVCLPRDHLRSSLSGQHPLVLAISPQERVYDLGISQNWASLNRQTILRTKYSSSFDWPKLNPGLLSSLKKKIDTDTDI